MNNNNVNTGDVNATPNGNFDIKGAYHSTVSFEKNKLYLVKARKSAGCLVLTSPYAKKGDYYAARIDNRGVITYTPLAIDGKKPYGMRVVKAYLTGSSVALTATVANEGEYYHVSVDDNGVITYTPMLLAAKGVDE